MSDFDNRNFPDAVDSDDVEYMMVEWRIMKEYNKCVDCGGDYSLNSNQFEDMPIGTNLGQAVSSFRNFVNNRRQHTTPNDPDAPVRTTLFLLKVIKVSDITDDNRNLIAPNERDV